MHDINPSQFCRLFFRFSSKIPEVIIWWNTYQWKILMKYFISTVSLWINIHKLCCRFCFWNFFSSSSPFIAIIFLYSYCNLPVIACSFMCICLHHFLSRLPMLRKITKFFRDVDNPWWMIVVFIYKYKCLLVIGWEITLYCASVNFLISRTIDIIYISVVIFHHV